jgi:hypothetical protein
MPSTSEPNSVLNKQVEHMLPAAQKLCKWKQNILPKCWKTYTGLIASIPKHSTAIHVNPINTVVVVKT